jgi:mRNA-degrading endonuclease toxin of MazEF toxin-antitoxin module
MKTINEKLLETLKNGSNRFKQAVESTPLIQESRKVLINFYHFSKNLKVLELASILISLNAWQKSKSKGSKKNFNTRDIVEVDLGLGHGFEMSYRHPCIVLHNSQQGFCFVVPCSTGKYGKNNRYILDGEVSDGFSRPSGVLLDATRTISKVRITGKVGEITVPFLQKLNDELIKVYFPRQNHHLFTLGEDLKKSEAKNVTLHQRIIELEEKIKKDEKPST